MPRSWGDSGLWAAGTQERDAPPQGADTAAWSEAVPALHTATSSLPPFLFNSHNPPGCFSWFPFLISKLLPRWGVCLCTPHLATFWAAPGFGAHGAQRGGGAGLAPSGQVTHLPRWWASVNMVAPRGRCPWPGSAPASTRSAIRNRVGGTALPLRANARAVSLVHADRRT